MSQQLLRVLLADDESSLREPLAKHLRHTHSYDVDTASDAQEVLTRLEQAQGCYEVALIDDLLVPAPGQEPEPMGITLTKEIKTRYPNIEIIVFTGWGMKSGLEALRAGAYRYLAKPLNLEELGMLIQTVAEHSRLKGVAREKKMLERLMETSAALLSGRTLSEVLDAILQGVQAIGFDRVCLYLLSEGRQTMVGKAQVNIGEDFVGHERPVATDAQMKVLLADPRPHVFAREEDELLPFERELAREGVHQWACVPLILQGEVIGKLSIDNKFSQRPIVESELGPVALFAAQAAAAIENARLVEKEQEAIQKAEQRAHQLEVLHQINAHISSALSLDGILQVALSEGLRVVRASEGSIMLVNPTTSELEIKAWIVQGEAVAGKYHRKLALGEGIAGYVAIAAEAYNCPDVSKDTRFVDSFTGRSPQSLLSIPIVSHGRVLGTINADSKQPYFFTEDDVRFLSALANHVAIAIEAHRLRDISMVLSTQTLDEMLAKVVESVCVLTGTEFGTISLIDEKSGDLVRAAKFPCSREMSSSPRKKRGLTELVINSGEAIVISDAHSDARVRQSFKDDGVKALMGVPLKVRVEHTDLSEVRTIGVLFVFTTQQWEISNRDVELLQSLASQAAIAIEKARLHEEVAVERDRSEWMASQLLALYEVTKEMLAELDLPSLLNLICERAVKLLQAQGGGLYLLGEAGQRVKMAAVSNLPKHLVGTTLSVGDSVVGRVIKTKVPLAVADYRSWPDRLRKFDSYGFTAVAGAPIAWQDKIWGAIAVHDEVEGRTFGQKDLSLLSYLGNLAAVALENARRTDELERLMASAIDAIIAIDEAGKVVKFNQQAEKVLGYRAEEVLGQSVGRLYHDLEEARRVRWLLLESKEGTITDYDTFIRGKDGEKIPIRLSASLLFDYEGKLAGSVGFFRDLREIESARRQIRQLDGLLATGQAITSQLDLPRVLDAIAMNSMKALGDVDAIVVYLYDVDKAEFKVLPINKGVRQPEFMLGSFKPNSVVVKLMEIGEAYFADDAVTDPVMAGGFVSRESIASSAGIPLKVGDRTVGIMFFNYRESHPFTGAEKNIISILANQAAIAIENACLYEEVRQRAEQFQTLYQASLNLTAELSVGTVLREVVCHARQLTRAQYGALGVLDAEGKIKSFITSGLESTEQERIGAPPEGHGVLGLLLREPKPIRMLDIRQHPSFTGFPLHHPEMFAFLGVPIISKGTFIGNLYMANKLGAPEFSQEDQNVLELVAAQAAIAIENARLFEQTKRRARLLDAAAQVARGATAILDINKLLTETARLISDCFGFYHSGVFLLDEKREFAVLEAAYPKDGHGMLERGHKLKVGQQGIVGHVAQTGKPHLAPEVDKDSYHLFNPELPQTRSEMAFPLRARDRVIGVLDVQSDGGRELRPEDISTLQILADQLANAIHNAQQYDELKCTKRLVDARTNLAWMGMASSTWRHAIEGHAITIREEVQQLRSDLPQQAIDRVDRRLTKVERLTNMILDKPITPPLSEQDGVESVSVNELLRERLRQLWENEPYKSVRRQPDFRLDDTATVRASPAWLRQAFDVLVENAIEAMADTTAPVLTISSRAAGPRAEIVFADTGIGIPEDVRPKLFREPIRKPQGSEGLGMGLLMAQTIVQTYGGDILVQSTTPNGTSIVVSLPLDS